MTAVCNMYQKPVQRFISRLHVMFKAIKYNDLFRDQSSVIFFQKRCLRLLRAVKPLSEVSVSTRSSLIEKLRMIVPWVNKGDKPAGQAVDYMHFSSCTI